MQWLPAQLQEALSKGVIGQDEATREIAVALTKHLNGAGSGNLLLIGASGTGKTTLMRRVEQVLERAAKPEERPLVVRMNAAVLADEEASRTGGHVILRALFERAKDALGSEASVEDLVAAVERSVVFIDEIDKIRSEIGGRANPGGIRAQEALLTLMEAESVLMEVTVHGATREVVVRSENILFVAGGAFEGLHEIVYERVTVGRDAGTLEKQTVMTPWGEIVERERFELRALWKTEDLFAYGISPQFLGRFEGIVFLNDLSEPALRKILLDVPDSVFQASRNYFRTFGVDLQITPKARDILCAKARENPRLGARALRTLYKRVIASYEFEPDKLPLREGPEEGDLPIFVLDDTLVMEALGLQPQA